MPRFVIQEHYARSHHFDLRLERGGVLVSWSVPKGMPKDMKKNRLAIRVEDHALSHLYFEEATSVVGGPEGAVKKSIWDSGTYTPEQVDDDEVIVDLHGRLRGRYAIFRTGGKSRLVHMKPSGGDDHQGD